MEKKQIFVFIAIIMLVLVAITSGCVEKSTVMVPMEDGVRLATDIYTSNITKGSHGSILIRTPYDKYKMTYVGNNRALFGWPTVIQNMRGRFDSEGNDTVFRNENTDGATTLAWMANQSWSNGKIATWGGSALGITQYLMAGENPPELACQFIQVATPNMYKNLYHGGQFRYQLAYKWLEYQNSLHVLPELYENENYSIEWWGNVSLEDNWHDVNVPAIHIGGWYDCFAQGIVDGFMGYQYNGGSGAQGKSKLIMGPWTHSGSFGTNQGQLVYPENSLDTFSEGLFMQMIRQYTMNKATSFDDWPAVYYYVMSDVDDPTAPGNEWRSADEWPLQHSKAKWYFHENGVLSTNNPSEYDPLTYTYDPSNPVSTVGGQNLCMPAGPYNQIFIENRSDVLVFTSDELVEPYEATGPIKAKLFVSSDCPDTDFTVKLTDVYPDGRSMLICDGILRMRNRNGVDHWEFMDPGEVYEVEVDLWSSSYIWNTGHKIRVAISSSNYPRFLNNPNTNDAVAKNTTYNIAQNTLYLDSEHSSCIILPEIEQQAMNNQRNTPNIKNSYGSLRENLRNLIIKFFYRSRFVQDDVLTDSYPVNYGYK